MVSKIRISIPFDDSVVSELKAGTPVLLTGVIYTARDAAHKRMIESLEREEALPFNISGQVIYYVGMCPAKPGFTAGPAGPTTAGRMDKYTPKLIELGLKGMIGKGKREEKVVEAMKKNNSIYFSAIGGAAALIADSIKQEEIIAYNDLGTEAIRRLYVEDFPAIVAIDSKGNNIYETEPEKYTNLYKPEIQIKTF